MNKKTKPAPMVPTRALSDAAQFFWEHAGYSYGTEGVDEGRTRSAESFAKAEELYLQAHRVADIGITWEADPDGYNDFSADKKAGRINKGAKRPESIEQAYIWWRDDAGEVEYLAHRGGILDADSNYRRVIRAELAEEAADALRQASAQRLETCLLTAERIAMPTPSAFSPIHHYLIVNTTTGKPVQSEFSADKACHVRDVLNEHERRNGRDEVYEVQDFTAEKRLKLCGSTS